MNIARIASVNYYLKSTAWYYMPGNGCTMVVKGLVTHYFFFNENDTILNVITD